MSDDDPHGCLHREEASGVGVVVEMSDHVTVVQVEVKRTRGIMAAVGGVRWAES